MALICKTIQEWKPESARPPKKRVHDYASWVPLPYVQGLFEELQALFKKFSIGVYCSPAYTVRSAASEGWGNPVEFSELSRLVYAVPCKIVLQFYFLLLF